MVEKSQIVILIFIPEEIKNITITLMNVKEALSF